MNKEKIRWIIFIILIGLIVLSVQRKEDSGKKSEASYSYEEYIDRESLFNDKPLSYEVANDAYTKVLLEEKERLRIIKEQEAIKQKELQAKKSTQANVNSRWMTMEATYYTSRCNGCTGKTSYGINVKNTIYSQGYRVIAVDPSVIKLGSIVEVSTFYGTFQAIAGDTGGDVKHHRIDILVATKDEAYSLGRHNVKVRVIKSGK